MLAPPKPKAEPVGVAKRPSLAAAIADLVPGYELVERPKPAPSRQSIDYAGVSVYTYVYPRSYRPHEAGQKAHALQVRRDRVAEGVAREALLRPEPVRFLVMCAGRRGGKTKAGAAQFVSNILADLEDKLLGQGHWQGEPHEPWEATAGKDPEPFLRYFVISPVHALNDEPKIALRKYLGHKDDPEPGLIVDQHEKPSVWWLKGGIRIDFLSGDRPLLNVSHGYNGGWLEEAARLKDRVWQDNLRPALSDHSGWAIFSTTPLGRNWFWEEVWALGDVKAAGLVAKMQGKDIGEILDTRQFGCIAWTTAENTAIPGLKEEMEIARRQLSPANFKRNYLADFEAFEGQLFDLLELHFVRDRWQPGMRRRAIYAGFDPGMRHRASCAMAVELPDGGWREIGTDSAAGIMPYGDDPWKLRAHGDRSTWANRMWAMLHSVVGDRWCDVPVFLPADRPDIAMAWESYGFTVLPAYQEHEPAVTWMQTALLNKRFTVCSESLWTCMTALRYPGPGERSKKLWMDINDDEWDGLRYALTEVIRDGHSPLADGAPLAALGWKARR